MSRARSLGGRRGAAPGGACSAGLQRLLPALAVAVLASPSSGEDGGLALYLSFDGPAAEPGSPARRIQEAGGSAEIAGNASWGAGKYGRGVTFNGKGGAIRVSPAALGPFRQATVVLWLKVERLPAQHSYLIAGRTKGAGSGWYLELYDDGKLSAWQCDPDLKATAAYPPDHAAWHSVAAVYTGARIELYVDGRLLASAPGVPLPRTGGLPFLVSGVCPESEGWQGGLRGTVDEVKLYRRALGPEEVREAMQRGVARVVSPPPPAAEKPSLPEQIEILEEPRPPSASFLPKSSPPARELLVVDARPLSPELRLALACLQALTSRKRPEIWLIFKDPDRRWLEWHREAGYIDGFQHVEEPRALFRRFAACHRGAVIPDTELYRGVLLAANLAGVEDLIVASPALARELGIEVRENLQGRFSTYAEGMEWLWERYRDRFHRHVLACLHPEAAFNGTAAYDIQWRSLIFWIAGEGDGEEPGADRTRELLVMANIFRQLPPNAAVRGFPHAPGGSGLGETEGVRFFGGYGKALVPCDQTANVVVMSGVRIDRLQPPEPPPPPPLERDKIYVALALSDGDNLNTFYDDLPAWFEHPARGRFPLAWGMGPAILDLMPAVARWYYERAQPGDEFLADVSGMAYVFPDSYGHRYRERERVLREFLQWTGCYMRRLGMETVRPHGARDETLELYARELPFLHSIFSDYGRRRRPAGGRAAWYRLASGTPVFRALTDWRSRREGLVTGIRAQVGEARPAFVNAFVHLWSFDMEALDRAVRNQGDDMVFVAPRTLARLYEAAREAGWAE